MATTQTHPDLVRCCYGRLSDPDVGLVSVFHARSQVVIAGVFVGSVYQDELELERDLVVVDQVAGVACVHLLQ